MEVSLRTPAPSPPPAAPAPPPASAGQSAPAQGPPPVQVVGHVTQVPSSFNPLAPGERSDSGPASALMALRFAGLAPIGPPETAQRSIDVIRGAALGSAHPEAIRDLPVTADDLVRAMASAGAKVKQTDDPVWIYAAARNGLPVVLGGNIAAAPIALASGAQLAPAAHSVTLTGYDPEGKAFVVNDPAFPGGPVPLSQEQVETYRQGQPGLIVSRPDGWGIGWDQRTAQPSAQPAPAPVAQPEPVPQPDPVPSPSTVPAPGPALSAGQGAGLGGGTAPPLAGPTLQPLPERPM